MKKLLLVLLVVTLASFLFVGCLPTTPAEGEGEGEGEGEVGICPTVVVTSQVEVAGKTYLKAGKQTITVTFAVPTEPVSVYVGNALKVAPASTTEVVMYANLDKTVYTGTFTFGKSDGYVDCVDAYIYVDTCLECDYCKYPYIVDATGPASEIEIRSKVCVCEGVTLTLKTPAQSTVCGVTGVCCGDKCSGFASYAIDLYTSDPFDVCCDIPCITPAYSCPGGVACPVDCELTCIAAGTATVSTKEYWVVASLLDNVGNKTRYYARVVLDTDSIVSVYEYPANLQSGLCTDFTNGGVDKLKTDSTTLAKYGLIGLCK
jgi:hypothetical protein